jgi:ribose transport system substrate-binding protein
MHASKKAMAAVAIFGVAIALAGCSSSSGATHSASSGPYKIAFIPGDANDAYYGSVGCGIQAVAKKNNAKVTVQEPATFSPTAQTPILQSVIATKPDAIIIAPTDAKALYAPLKQAVNDGIKVILVDTTLDDPSLASAQVTSNNEDAGKVAATTLVEALGGASGSVITVNLSAGVSTTDAREKGFATGIKSHAGLTYLGQQYSNNSVQTAESIVSATIAAHSNLVGVFSTAAFNTEGAVAALKSANVQSKVKIVGFDANPSGIKQIKDGDVYGQVVLKPYDEGTAAAQQTINALEGKPVTKMTTTGALVATAKNLNSAPVQKYLYSYTCPTS